MPKLNKKLNLYGLTMIAVGACIGTGIFLVTKQIAIQVPHPTYILLVWLLGGVIALTGALTFAELGGMFPKAGGVYVFLKEAYGDLAGFLYGWCILLVINTGALAALGIGFAEYLKAFYPEMTEVTKMWLAGFTISGLTILNLFGVQIGQAFANIFTGTKLLAIGGIILIGFIFYEPSEVNLDIAFAAETPDNIIAAMLVALVGVLFSMGGWHHVSYMAGEAVDAKRTVPRAMVLGVLTVMITYILVNLAYLMMLPIEEIQTTQKVASDAVASIFPGGDKWVAIVITISIFGTIGIYTMTAPRIYFAMARDGIFFQKLAWIHPKWKTPVFAMGIQVIWAIIILVFYEGFFDKIITYVTFMDIVFMTLAGVAVFIFRKKRPDAERPIKTWGYPFIPLIFVSISTAFLIAVMMGEETVNQALVGLGVLGSGVVVYYLYQKFGKEG